MAKELLNSKFTSIVDAIKDQIEQESKLEDILTYLCQQIVFSLECPGVWIGIKEEGGLVKSLARAGELAQYLDEVEVRWDDTALSLGAVGQAINTGKIQILEVNGNERLLPWFSILKKLKINILLSIPITYKESSVVGALTIYNKNTDEFRQEKISVITTFATYVSMIIELKRTRDFVEKYRPFFERTQDIVLSVEPEGKIVKANKAAGKTYRYSREELLTLNILDLKTDIKQNLRQEISVAKETGMVFDTMHRKKDGTLFPAEVSLIDTEINGRKLLISHIRDISKRKRIENEYLRNEKEMTAKVNCQTTRDVLTELPNRTVFIRELRENLNKKQKEPFSFFFIDIDRFKFINDNYGHDIGDILLIKVAERIKCLLNEKDIICRYGGDEFAILVNSKKTSAKIYQIAAKIINRCFQRFMIRGHELYISVSIGIAVYPNNGENIDSLLKHADKAMYSAKKNGGNRYQVYVSEEDTKPFKSYSLLGNLNKAIRKNEFVLHYQPQLELATGRVNGVEALIRWVSPTGLIKPADFIPLAEDTGLIVPIGEWVIKTACEQNKIWQENECRDLKMSVNISARQFYQPNFVDTLKEILADTNLDPKSLNIEITESIAMKDFDSASQIIQNLSDFGLSITIDDFGIGYSSLNYLANLDLNFLKIDKSLIENLHNQAKKSSVVKDIVHMAHNLGMKVIAEGVESQEELDFLKHIKCDLVQGFLIGHPLSKQQVVRCFSL